jgi:dienelactone hydrolase
MIHFDGFDVTKEWMYLCGISREFAARGISTLMVDHPGIGAALRLQGLAMNPESERWASAAMDWLESRDAVDARRVGVVAMSLGGYYAPRAAAFEKRLAASVAWGARWENSGSHGRILRDPNAARSVTNWVEHALWYYGAKTPDEAYNKIAQMTLEGIADRITCPLLVVHGENDRQVPTEQAERTVQAAVNSPRAELRIFTPAEGGAEHVGGDLFSPTIDYIADWVAEVLRA